MLNQVVREDILNSAMNSLHGRYVNLFLAEERLQNPNREKIQFYRERCKEITEEYWAIFNQTDSFKEAAIKKYSEELNKLNQFS